MPIAIGMGIGIGDDDGVGAGGGGETYNLAIGSDELTISSDNLQIPDD